MKITRRIAILGTALGAVAVIGAGTALATTSHSATPAPNKLCYSASGSVIAAHGTCPNKYKTFTGTVGPKGATGARGAAGARGATGLKGTTGSAGKNGDPGPVGATGKTGASGATGLTGAYYAVARYDVGDTNGGAIATVACKATTDVAISGGVQTLALGTNGIGGNVPVSSSFPGRMDWATNTPIAGDLSGWIVQFGGNSSATSLGNPSYVDVYALCVPGADIPADTTYTESGS